MRFSERHRSGPSPSAAGARRRRVDPLDGRLQLVLLVEALVELLQLREGAGRLELVDELIDVVHALGADTMIVTTMPRFGSSFGRMVAIRTSSGSVISKTVEQLGPRERAAVDQVVGLARVDRRQFERPRVDGGAQPRGRWLTIPRACASSRAACVSSCVSWRDSWTISRHVERPSPPAPERRDAEQDEADRSLVVERTRREVGPDHAASRPRSSRPTSGASVSSSAGATEMRSVNAAAVRGSTFSTGGRQPLLEAATRSARPRPSAAIPPPAAPASRTRLKPPPPRRSS